MFFRRESPFAAWILSAVVTSAALTAACGNRAELGEGGSNAEAPGEPEWYSATIVRTIEDGVKRETSISREARAGEQRREEWTTGTGQKRALIWMPNIGKAFLLDLDQHAYVEIDIPASSSTEARAGTPGTPDVPSPRTRFELGVTDETVHAIDQYFDDSEPPAGVETRAFPNEVVDGHTCSVYEQRSTFRDGHTETSRRFSARDLSGLLLRVESHNEPGVARVITERRDVRIEAAPDLFLVPTDFRRVEKLAD